MNASILDRNVCHAFEAYDAQAPMIGDAYWRFRNGHTERCAERLAELAQTHFALSRLAAAVTLPMLPEAVQGEPGQDWRVIIELDHFIRERLHHYEGACLCKDERP